MGFLSRLFDKKSEKTVSTQVETDFLMVACDNLISKKELDFLLSSYDDVEASAVMVPSPANPFFNRDWEKHVGTEWSKNHWTVKCPAKLRDKIALGIDEFKSAKTKIAIHKSNKPAVLAA